MAFSRDTAFRRRSETATPSQAEVFKAMASDVPLSEVLDRVCRHIEQQSDGMRSSILLLDQDGLHLRHGAGPNLPAEFMRAIDGEPIGPAAGSCGTAAYRRAPVIVTDIASDPLWEQYRSGALAHGLRACWSVPILTADGNVLGTFASYYQSPRSPSALDLELVSRAADLARIAIEHRRAADALAQSESRFRTAFDEAPVGVCLTGLDGRFLRVNRAMCAMFDYPEDELLSMDFMSVTHPDDAAGSRQFVERQLAGASGPAAFEKRYVGRGGRVISAMVSTNLLRDERGRPLYFITHVVDITARKESERLLHLADRQRAAILDSVSDAFVALDREWRYTYVNKKAGETFGRRPEDLIGKHIWTEFPEGVGEPFHRAYERAMAEQVPIVIEEYYAPYDKWFENRIYPSAEGLAVYFTDITKQKRAIRALRESEAHLIEAQRTAKIGHWRFVPGQPLLLSDQMFELFGLRRGVTPTYDDIVAVIHPDDQKGDQYRALERVLQSDATDFQVERRVLLRDGSVRNVFAVGKILRNADGSVMEAFGTVQDITERKQAEQSLRELTRELITAREEERADIAREMHDELGQQLTALKMDVAALARRLPACTPEVDAHFAAVQELIDRSVSTVRNLASSLRPGILDDLGLAAALEWQAQEFSTRTGIPCEVRIGASLPFIDRTMATSLFRIFQESLTNVARHANATGIDAVLDDTGDALILEVRDNGRGIAPNEMAGSRSMGLAGMRERAALVGGVLSIERLAPRGTLVSVRVPNQGSPRAAI